MPKGEQGNAAMKDALHPEEQKGILESPDVPLWQKILNLDASRFERSKYTGFMGPESKGKHRLKDLSIVREMAPGIHQAVAEDIKEYDQTLFETKGQMRKYKLGRKLGSIPAAYFALHPELNSPDESERSKAQDKFFEQFPECKVKET